MIFVSVFKIEMKALPRGLSRLSVIPYTKRVWIPFQLGFVRRRMIEVPHVNVSPSLFVSKDSMSMLLGED